MQNILLAGVADQAGIPVWGTVLYIGVIVLAMYFLLFRPQRKKKKEDAEMRDNLQVGDEIITIGGIYGRVISLKEDTFIIESKSDHTKFTFAKWALQSNVTAMERKKAENAKKASAKKVKEK